MKSRGAFLAVVLGAVLWSMSSAYGSSVHGSISVDTLWDTDGSPYILAGDVTVLAGVTLTVAPGVEIRSDNGHYDLSGRVVAGPPPKPLTSFQVNLEPGASAREPGRVIVSRS